MGFKAFDAPNYIDPSGFAEDSVMAKLEELIQKVNQLRSLGTWIMTCPRVKVTATCTKTYECQGGRWVLTTHVFDLQYGQRVGQASQQWDNFDKDNPARGSAETMQHLQRQFASMNQPQMRRMAAMVRACAAPH